MCQIVLPNVSRTQNHFLIGYRATCTERGWLWRKIAFFPSLTGQKEKRGEREREREIGKWKAPATSSGNDGIWKQLPLRGGKMSTNVSAKLIWGFAWVLAYLYIQAIKSKHPSYQNNQQNWICQRDLQLQSCAEKRDCFVKHQPGMAGCGWLQAGRNFLST